MTWSDEQLLDMRLCDLHLQIKGTRLAGYIKQLHKELAATSNLIFVLIFGFRMIGILLMGFPEWPFPFIWPTRVWPNSNRIKCSRLKEARKTGVCESFGTKPGMPLKMPTGCDADTNDKNYLERHPNPIRIVTCPNPTAKVLCSI